MRRIGLESIVAAAGHQLVTAPDDSDVVLVDGDFIAADGQPVLALGAAEAGQPGLLPGDATPQRQIEVALQAVAAGFEIVRGEDLPHRTFPALGDETAPLLTPREIEVLAHSPTVSNKEAAHPPRHLRHTVKFISSSCFAGCPPARAEAVAKGLRQGLIEL